MSGQNAKKGRNERETRSVNERLELLVLSRPAAVPTDRFLIVCECADEACAERIGISIAEYERVREHPLRFVVHPTHADEALETVVAREGAFAVVERRGDADGRTV